MILKKIVLQSAVMVFTLVGVSVSYLIAGPCFRNTNSQAAPWCNSPGNTGAGGPCPAGYTTMPIPSCGMRISNVAVPGGGTAGNLATGRSSQGYNNFQCQIVRVCTRSTSLMPVGTPPGGGAFVLKQACVMGRATVSGTANVFGAFGSVCPADGG